MRFLPLSDTLAGVLALTCATVVVLATAFDAQARLGPAVAAATVEAPPTPPPAGTPAR